MAFKNIIIQTTKGVKQNLLVALALVLFYNVALPNNLHCVPKLLIRGG